MNIKAVGFPWGREASRVGCVQGIRDHALRSTMRAIGAEFDGRLSDSVVTVLKPGAGDAR
jgi:hypothetical protein